MDLMIEIDTLTWRKFVTLVWGLSCHSRFITMIANREPELLTGEAGHAAFMAM